MLSTPTKKILFIDKINPYLSNFLLNKGFQCDYFENYKRADFRNCLHEYIGVIIRSKISFDKEMIDAAIHLKFIARAGAGMESIDEQYALEKGIICLNSPEGNRDAVGEHTLGLLINLFHNISRSDKQVKQNNWNREDNRGTELKGKVIGIIGYGNMGVSFAKRLKGFEVNVLAFDKYKFNFSDENVTETTLSNIFENADIISFHTPLTIETKYYLNDNFINQFKKNIWIINTSRGLVINTLDLVKHLKTGKVLGAALDVLEYENISFEFLSEKNIPAPLQYLLQSENVILTPHIAGITKESDLKHAQVLSEKIIRVCP